MADFLEGDFRALIGGDNSDNRGSTLAVTANRDGSLLERTEDIIGQAERSVVSSTAILATGTTIFTIAGGPIKLLELISYCITSCDTTAATLQWSADGTVGAATTFTGASASLASFAAGGVIYCNFATLATAPVITGTTGVALSSVVTTGILVPAGIITTTIGSGPTTGTFAHYLRFKPMAPGITVTAS